jgi:aspartyl aminopeptidase
MQPKFTRVEGVGIVMQSSSGSRQSSDSTVMALAGHVSRAMMERYSHIRMEAKRRAGTTSVARILSY